MITDEQRKAVTDRVNSLPISEVARFLENQMNLMPDEQRVHYKKDEDKRVAMIEFILSTTSAQNFIREAAPGELTEATGEVLDDFELPDAEFETLAAEIQKGDAARAKKLQAGLAVRASLQTQIQAHGNRQRDPDDDEPRAPHNPDDDSDNPLGL